MIKNLFRKKELFSIRKISVGVASVMIGASMLSGVQPLGKMEVQAKDKTYMEDTMNSHLSEAYFLRGLCHFYLVRNFKEAPIVTEPYVDDSAPYDIAKSSEEDIIAQIKSDIQTALDSGAAKEFFEDDQWEGASKGRATKWALYALMADVCLWSED